MAIALPMLVPGALAAGATPVASSAHPVQLETLGRKNPFRPLILASDHGAPLALPPVSAVARPVPPSRPSISYLGVAYDGAESVAAVQVGGKVRFVRRGEVVAGAALSAISPEKLVWSQDRHRFETPLRRRPGAHKP